MDDRNYFVQHVSLMGASKLMDFSINFHQINDFPCNFDQSSWKIHRFRGIDQTDMLGKFVMEVQKKSRPCSARTSAPGAREVQGKTPSRKSVQDPPNVPACQKHTSERPRLLSSLSEASRTVLSSLSETSQRVRNTHLSVPDCYLHSERPIRLTFRGKGYLPQPRFS